MSLIFHLDQLRSTSERAKTLYNRIMNCADAFDGSRVLETAVGKMPHASSHTLNNQFDEVISELQATLNEMADEIQRIEEQVLDQPGMTIGARSATERSH